jgi:Arc/MetJ family transcription regulator
MRTTLTIDDELLELAKQRARARRTTLGKVVEDALRAALFEAGERRDRPFRLVTFEGDGPHEGIDLDRTSTLLAAEDVERYGPRK